MRQGRKSSRGPRAGWLAALTVALVATAAGARSPDSEAQVWRTQRMCGVNCLYVLLQAHDLKAPHSQLTDELLSGPVETSLADLQQSAARHGLACTVGKAGPEGLAAAPKPVIAHWDLMSPDGQSAGHFVLVTRTDEKTVSFFDGTTAQSEELPWNDFQKRWTGYLLYVPERTGPPWWTYLGLSALAGLCLGPVLARFLEWRRRGPRAEPSPHLIPEA